MAETSSINPQNGFCPQTKTYHSLRPAVPLPPPSQHLSISQYALSLLHSTATSTTPFLIDAATSRHLTYPAFLRQVASLSASLKPLLSENDVAFILSPPSLHVPVLYFSLLSLGVAVSPSNPLSSPADLAHQIRLSRPAVAFATSETSTKLPRIDTPVIILDSPRFLSMLECGGDAAPSSSAAVDQSSAAAILYSSGTTGRVKGVLLTHRNLIALVAGLYHNKLAEDEKLGEGEEENGGGAAVSILTVPLFHVYGFFMLIRAAALGESVVLMERFDFVGMLEAVERYKVTYMPVTPPLVVAMAKSDLVDGFDLSSLQALGCGGAPLGKEVSERFRQKFPHVEILQGYGLTESTGGATRTMGPDEAKRHGSAGRLSENMEAKIVDPKSGEALPPPQRGELWLRGPSIMKGDDAATAAALDAEGWLKTGDLCYFDQDGFLFIVDRLKELIKYKAYQVPPAELEHLLQSIPEIVDAAVVPYPDEEGGEIPMAYVVRKPGSSLTATQIMDYIAKQVAPYKKIRRLAFIDSIPKSPAGKILRRELVLHAVSFNSSKL
ncbi:4-coumarate--CoA ligase-like 9 isoform X2 [Salvia miltiorrhiza]|uniref:4-coumarate--CoA ligase-like 9 isoform X2 n=1 Tax=Salvia miltiorrhiza TaxID=226208 RepID=UPI0025AB7C5C|nr:4-coumarate--CoA ligase-like 9 isoform X2 [Salvia miltiorrhiza]